MAAAATDKKRQKKLMTYGVVLVLLVIGGLYVYGRMKAKKAGYSNSKFLASIYGVEYLENAPSVQNYGQAGAALNAKKRKIRVA